MIIPNRNPRKLLMTSQQIKISPISCNSLTVVIESVDLLVRQRNTTNTVTPTVITVPILVDIISEMKNEVDGILSHRITVGVEETER